jgi:hypothetical protein
MSESVRSEGSEDSELVSERRGTHLGSGEG